MKNIRNYLIILIVLPLACGKSIIKDNSLAKSKIQKYTYEYSISNNLTYLDSSYKLIIDHKIVKSDKVDAEMLELIFPTYFKLQKYQELSKILKKTSKLDENVKVFTTNLLDAYSYYKKKNAIEAGKYINKNILHLENQIITNDRSLIVDLYKMKSHIIDIDLLINEIDSLSKNTKQPTSDFYRTIVKSEIKEYYKNIPKFDNESE